MENQSTSAVNDNTNAQQTTQTATPAATPAAEPAAQNAPQAQATTGTLLGGEATPASATAAPEAYDFKASIPEGMEMDQGLTDQFSEISRGMNLTNEQANKMAAFGIQYGQQVAEAVQVQFVKEVEDWGTAAKQELGANFETTLQTCGAGIEAVEKVVPGIRQALNETGAGNRIEVIKAFEYLGKLVQSDPGKLADVNSGTAPKKANTWYNNSNMA